MTRGVQLPTVPRHGTRVAELSGQSVTLPSGGLVLGTTDDAPLIVRLFRAAPLRVCVAAPIELAQLITFRSIALGAHVTVVSDAVTQWSRLMSAVPRGPHWMTVLPAGSRVSASGSIVRPSLVLDATSDRKTLPRWEQAPWQTFVSLRADLDDDAQIALRSHDLLITQRLSNTGADIVRRAFGLPQDRAAWLTQMPPGVLAVATVGQLAFGQISLSTVEQQLFAGR